MRTISYGGGVQSTALLVLAARGEIDYTTFIHADPGSEYPETVRYIAEIAAPFCREHGLDLHVLERVKRDGTVERLSERLWAGRTAIPVRRTADGPPMSRSCTADFKVSVIGKWLKARGATVEHPAIVGLGISTDEMQRAKPGRDASAPYQVRTYPLLDLGLSRNDCERIIADVLPVPPPSSCTYCPYHSAEMWRRLKRQHPDLFEEACAIEEHLSATQKDGRPVYLTRKGSPLRSVFADDQLAFFESDDCESGFCMT